MIVLVPEGLGIGVVVIAGEVPADDIVNVAVVVIVPTVEAIGGRRNFWIVVGVLSSLPRILLDVCGQVWVSPIHPLIDEGHHNRVGSPH